MSVGTLGCVCVGELSDVFVYVLAFEKCMYVCPCVRVSMCESDFRTENSLCLSVSLSLSLSLSLFAALSLSLPLCLPHNPLD